MAHLDLYRLAGLELEEPALLADYLGPGRIAFVEWPQDAARELSEPAPARDPQPPRWGPSPDRGGGPSPETPGARPVMILGFDTATSATSVALRGDGRRA